MRSLLLLALLVNWSAAFAQEEPLVLPGKLPRPPSDTEPYTQFDISPYTTFYQDKSGDTLPLSVIRTRPFQPYAKKRNERATFSDVSVIVTWLRFTIRNSHPTNTLPLFYSAGAHGLITLYEQDRRIGETGIGLPPQPRQNRFVLPITILPKSVRMYYVRVIDYCYSPTPVAASLFSAQGNYDTEFPWQYAERMLLAVFGLLMGCLLFMSLYTFYSFVLTRDRAFLYYSLYALICFVFTLHYVDMRFSFAALFPLRMSEAIRPFTMGLIALLYTLFVAEVIQLPAHFPRIWLVVKGFMAVLVLQEIYSIIEWAHAKPILYSNTAHNYAMVPVNLITCILISAVLRSRSPIKNYLLAGMVGLLGVGFIPGTLKLYNHNLFAFPLAQTFVNTTYFWVLLGLSVEAFCFMLALAYRNRLVELERDRIQKNYTQDLKAQLAQRSQEIEQQSRLLEAQHIRQLETEFEHKLADTEMTALRAQVNPHFIFNCLNSIKLYTLQNDADRASDYLTKFSRLIRLVLENSRSELVPLQNELEALQLYIELEAMRFKHKVQFSIQVAPKIDQRYVCIPPLLLQPYVENAIWHGLMHKPEGGTVTVEVSQPQDNLLHIEITDDGVGRERAGELKSKSAGKHKSFGMQVTADRIRMINQLYNIQTQAQIFDLVAPDGEPLGTKVVLDIPV